MGKKTAGHIREKQQLDRGKISLSKFHSGHGNDAGNKAADLVLNFLFLFKDCDCIFTNKS